MSLLQAAAVTFFVSMVPVLELRGAIPMGVAGGLSHMSALVIAILGNLVPVPFLILFIRKIFDFLRKKPFIRSLVEKLELKAEKKIDVVNRYAWLGLCILVAIPLPGTGAWTGALVAAVMNMRLKRAMPSIALGVVIAGLITTSVTYGVTWILS